MRVPSPVAPLRLAPALLACLVIGAAFSSQRISSPASVASAGSAGWAVSPAFEPTPPAPEGPTMADPGAIRPPLGPWLDATPGATVALGPEAPGPTGARLALAAAVIGNTVLSPRPTLPRSISPPWTEPAWSVAWVRTPPTTVPPPPPTTAPPTTTSSPTPDQVPGTTHEVRSVNEWTAAVRVAGPGDVIRLAATIGRPLQYRGPRAPGPEAIAPDGAPGRPITITAADGVWIDPGNPSNVLGGLDVIGADHVHVVGVRVRNSQFGIRFLQSSGTAEHPTRVANNRVVDIGHAGIHVAGNLSTHAPSRFVRVEGNVVARTGRTGAPFGEGIYLGYGSQEWVDRSSNIVVAGNRISATTAEGIDVKPGTRNVTVAGNAIHDLSPISGGAISVHYVGTSPNPDPGTPGNVVVQRNRIWNVNLDNRAGSNDWAIWVGHGGVTVEANTIWGLRNDPGATRAVRVRGIHDFGPHPIRITDNVFWTANGWMAEGSPSGAGLVQASGNRGPAGAAGVESPLQPGPGVPPLGAAGPADSGGGPGSARGPRGAAARAGRGAGVVRGQGLSPRPARSC